MILQQIIPNKEVLQRSEILEILSEYTIISKNTQETTIPSVRDIKRIVEEVLEIDDLAEPSRRRMLSDARHIYCYICYYQRLGTLQEIGETIGRNHATVLHSFRTGRNMIRSKGEDIFKEKYYKVSNTVQDLYPSNPNSKNPRANS